MLSFRHYRPLLKLYRTFLLSRVSTHNRRYYCSNSEVQRTSESFPPSTHIAELSQRCLVRVEGQDGLKLLQGLVTVDVPELQYDGSTYSMLLNAQGRVLYDIIIYCHAEGHYAVECDSRVSGDVIKHLRRYALRSKVTIAPDTDTRVWAVYPGQPEEPLPGDMLLLADPRVSSFGSRILAPTSASASEVSPNLSVTSAEHYNRHRLVAGLAEGADEIPVGACFPLEYNLDFCNGVSFSKGCYLGQELTARTHHTGVVRKRVMPITWQQQLSDVTVPSGSKLFNSTGKNVGKVITHLGNIGLALLRVQEVSDGPLSLGSEHKELEVTASVPNWWPENAY